MFTCMLHCEVLEINVFSVSLGLYAFCHVDLYRISILLGSGCTGRERDKIYVTYLKYEIYFCVRIEVSNTVDYS